MGKGNQRLKTVEPSVFAALGGEGQEGEIPIFVGDLEIGVVSKNGKVTATTACSVEEQYGGVAFYVPVSGRIANQIVKTAKLAGRMASSPVLFLCSL